jgi:hypothetical protein
MSGLSGIPVVLRPGSKSAETSHERAWECHLAHCGAMRRSTKSVCHLGLSEWSRKRCEKQRGIRVFTRRRPADRDRCARFTVYAPIRKPYPNVIYQGAQRSSSLF